MTRKEAIQEKIKQLKEQLASETTKEKVAKRKREARLKIVLGAKLMADSSQSALVKKYTAEFEREEKEREANKAKTVKATVV